MADINYSSLGGGGGTASGSTNNRPASPAIGDTYYNGTLGRLEIYTSNGWMSAVGSAKTPTPGTPSDVGTNRAFNNAAASISITPSSEGAMPARYRVTSSPGSIVATSSSNPVIITGLSSNTSYTFTVEAESEIAGYSAASSASSSVTVTSVPQAPTVSTPTVVAGTNYGSTTSLDVPFTAGATGGKTVTSYTVTSSPGGFTASGSSSPLRVSGLTGGTSYTFTATATNDNGTSLASSASPAQNAVTKPDAPVLGTVSVSSPTSVSIPFTINNGGQAPTSFTVTSSPSISLSTSSTTSPLSVTGSFASGTSYTFTVTATNSGGTSNASSASNSVTPNPAYALSQTYNSSGTFTMPAGKTKVAVYAFSGAQPGSSGSGYDGGSGGTGSRGGAFKEYSASSGTNFNVTVGGSGGTTSFGNLLTVTPNAVNNNVANTVSAAGGSGGSGGGGNGSAGAALTLNGAGLVTYNAGGGGAGGGNGCAWNSGMAGYPYGSAGCGGNAGGNVYTKGGDGGSGGWGGYAYNGMYYHGAGGNGTNGTNLNGGGGGGGGGSSPSGGPDGGGGGNGSAGRVYVYTA